MTTASIPATLRFFLAGSLLLAACGEIKRDEPGLDFGAEDAAVSAKDDSATSPASMKTLELGSPQRTTFTATNRWRAFTFSATAGEAIDLLADGLRSLDTVAYVYNVSAATGRPYGRPIARNDDTESPGWTVGTSTAVNEQSSSISGFVPRFTRKYVLVVTTYGQAGRGSANVVVRAANAKAVSSWRAEGPAREVYRDTASAHHASPVGSVGVASSPVGRAFDFRAEAYLSAGDPRGLRMTGSMSVTFWMNPRNERRVQHILSRRADCGPVAYQVALDCASALATDTGCAEATRLQLNSGDGSPAFGALSAPLPRFANRWTHVGIVYRASSRVVDFFVNGKLLSSTTAPFASLNDYGPAEVTIAHASGCSTAHTFDGLLDEIQISRGELSEAQVAAAFLRRGP